MSVTQQVPVCAPHGQTFPPLIPGSLQPLAWFPVFSHFISLQLREPSRNHFVFVSTLTPSLDILCFAHVFTANGPDIFSRSDACIHVLQPLCVAVSSFHLARPLEDKLNVECSFGF